MRILLPWDITKTLGYQKDPEALGYQKDPVASKRPCGIKKTLWHQKDPGVSKDPGALGIK